MSASLQIPQRNSVQAVTPSPDRKSMQSDFKIKTANSVSSKLSRSSSLRTKGLNVFAVSPAATPPPAKSTSTRNTPAPVSSVTPSKIEIKPDEPKSHTKPDLKYDVTLPSNEKLATLKIEEQLRLLALKEMSIVEIKDNIKTLNSKLSVHEQELNKLRRVIQTSLHKEVRSSAIENQDKRALHQNNNSQNRTKGLTSPNPNLPHILQESNAANKIWNGISKPLNMLDNLLQQEFEKSLVPEPTQHSTQYHLTSHRSRSSQGSFSSIGSNTSPLRGKSKRLSTSEAPAHERHSFVTDDMIQTVSSSIWSFVNDVKANVLSSLTDEDYTATLTNITKENLESGTSLDDLTNRTITQTEVLSECEDDLDLLEPVVTDDDDDDDEDIKIDLSIYRK